MGKNNTTYKAADGLAKQLLLAMSPSRDVDASFDFLVAGTPKDSRRDLQTAIENAPR